MVFAVGSVWCSGQASTLSSTHLDWQPSLAFSQPWRAWSAAFVHFSVMHLAANLLGAAVVAALGWAARCGGRATLAWCLAWPVTQWGLLLQAGLQHFGGLSGVLHAGVAVAAVQLMVKQDGPDNGSRGRVIALLLLLGLVVKIVLEAPWAEPTRQVDGWDIAIAPLVHATGAAAGLCCGVLLLIPWRAPSLSRTRRHRRPDAP